LILRKYQSRRADKYARAGDADIIDLSLDFRNEVVKADLRTKSSPGATSYIVALGGPMGADNADL